MAESETARHDNKSALCRLHSSRWSLGSCRRRYLDNLVRAFVDPAHEIAMIRKPFRGDRRIRVRPAQAAEVALTQRLDPRSCLLHASCQTRPAGDGTLERGDGLLGEIQRFAGQQPI